MPAGQLQRFQPAPVATINAKHTGSATHFAWSGTSLSSSNNRRTSSTQPDSMIILQYAIWPGLPWRRVSTGYVWSLHWLFQAVQLSWHRTLLSSVSRLELNRIGFSERHWQYHKGRTVCCVMGHISHRHSGYGWASGWGNCSPYNDIPE